MAEPPEKKEKVCHSCGLDDQGQSTLLDADGARAAFAALPENLWTLEDKRLTRKFTAKNFLQAVAFVNAVAPVAEAARHHPDIHLTNYRDSRTRALHALAGRPDARRLRASIEALARRRRRVAEVGEGEPGAGRGREDGRRGVGCIRDLLCFVTASPAARYLAGRLRGKQGGKRDRTPAPPRPRTPSPRVRN